MLDREEIQDRIYYLEHEIYALEQEEDFDENDNVEYRDLVSELNDYYYELEQLDE